MEKFGVIELSSKEMISIEGGKTLCYYLGLIAGATVGTIVSLVKGVQDGYDNTHA
jgi:patatin-like phospholipase/acyl hydrolase